MSAPETIDVNVVDERKAKRSGKIARVPKSRSVARTGTIEMQPLMLSAIEKGEPGVMMLRELLAMKHSEATEEARKAWHDAVAAFQNDCPPIPRTKEGRFGKYAKLGSELDIVRPALGEHGLSVTWKTRRYESEPYPYMVCQLAHRDGHVEESEVAMIVDEAAGQHSDGKDTLNTMQKVAIAHTYARRYSFEAVAGLAPTDEVDDTDGNAPEPPRRRSASAKSSGPDEEPPHPAQTAPAPRKPQAQKKKTESKTTSAPERSRVFIVEMKEPRTGKRSDGSKWTKQIGISHDGHEYATFSETIGADLIEANEQEIELDVLWKEGRYGRDIIELIEDGGPEE